MTWGIVDWTGRRILPGETFESFEEARGRISEIADAEADKEPTETRRENTYNGICEDLYAEEVTA